MTQDEILTRVREAHIKTYGINAVVAAAVRAGKYDNAPALQTPITALTDAHLPLSEIAPPDPDLLAAREWMAETCPDLAENYLSGQWDLGPAIQGFLAGCRHARGDGA